MVLSRYCKQRIVQLYFERKVSYGRIAKVLAAEGLKKPKKTIWTTISKYKAHGTLSRLPGSGRCFKLMPKALAMIEAQMQACRVLFPWDLGEQLLELLAVVPDQSVVYVSHLHDSVAHGLWGSSVFTD